MAEFLCDSSKPQQESGRFVVVTDLGFPLPLVLSGATYPPDWTPPRLWVVVRIVDLPAKARRDLLLSPSYALVRVRLAEWNQSEVRIVEKTDKFVELSLTQQNPNTSDCELVLQELMQSSSFIGAVTATAAEEETPVQWFNRLEQEKQRLLLKIPQKNLYTREDYEEACRVLGGYFLATPVPDNQLMGYRRKLYCFPTFDMSISPAEIVHCVACLRRGDWLDQKR